MKKRDLLFAGLLLIGASAFAQPVRTSQDAKQLFSQDFEADFETWSNQVVDVIDELYYYNNAQTGTKSNFKIWTDANKADFNFDNLILRTDSVIELKNGVMLTDDANEIKNHNYDKDQYTILEDQSQDRKDAFEAYGEADKGGQYLFQFISDTCHYAPSWNPSAVQTYTPEYRRNLFVRGLPIEDTTSYRLTFYVKATKMKDGAKPRLYADLMRGYFHAEKRFSMGLENDKDHYKYNAQYYIEKRGFGEPTDDDPDPFTGGWDKITLMSYYTNDSIANSFVFIDGYWWDTSWTWDAARNGTDHNLIYTVQPDKFFVRLSFSSDDTKFQVDNISLTKSTIGGVEYSGGKMRIDFGYKTNLGALAEAAKEKNKIDAVEVKNDNNKYFTVWGLMNKTTWVQVPIASAEYHGDGYMYMFTMDDNNGNPLSFNQYDSVLVTFHNPVDQPDLCLKYTGDGKSNTQTFPRAWDTTWVKNGKIVPDFYNEVGKKNPYAVQGVYSMKELPPVVQGTGFEDNSFGLPANTSAFTIKFSRKIDFDDQAENSTKLIARLGNEILTPSWETTNENGTGSGVLTLTRTSNAPLSGDKELKLIQLKGIGTPEAAPVTFHYHFGGYTRVDPWTKKSDWRSEINISAEDGLWQRPVPASLAYYYPGEGFFIGTGDNQFWTNADGDQKRTSLGLYKMNDNAQYGDCFWYLCANGTGKDEVTGKDKRGNLFTFDRLKAGNYTLSFAVFGWGTTSSVTHIYVYKKPAEIHTILSLDTLSGKVEIGKISKTKANKSWSGDEAAMYKSGGYDNKNLDWDGNTQIFEFPFTVGEEGEYVIEWSIEGRSTYYQGLAFGNYTISEKVSDELWFEPTNNLNKSVKMAQAVVDKADAAQSLYGGADLRTLKAKILEDQIGGSFTSVKPSEWAAEKKALDKLTSDFSTRMAEVDNLKAALDSVNSIKTTWAAKQEAGMLDYAAAVAGIVDYNYTVMTLDSIKNTSKSLNALIKNFNDYRSKFAELAKNRATSASLLDKYANTYASLDEYKAIAAAIEAYATFDSIGSKKDTLDKVVAAIASVNANLSGKITAAKIYELQIDALAELISGLDAGVEIPEEVEALDVILDDKVGIYMLYAQDALYIALADNFIGEDDTIEVSDAFVTNARLYTTITKEQLPGSHQIMNTGVGGAPLDLDFFPGWTYEFKKGNPYFGNGTSWQDGTVATAGNVANSFVNLDWNTGFVLSQTVEALPAGKYQLGCGYKIKNTANDGSMKVYSLADSTILADTLLNQFASGSAVGGADPNQFVDFTSKGGVILWFNPSCGNEGWGSFDNISLKFIGAADGFDYNGAIEDVEAAIEEKLTVAPVKAGKAAKYYNINGVEQTAPKAGLNIKVVDGVATKVFVK